MACYFRLNLASALEYRASFFIQAFGMFFSNSAFIFFWWIAFAQMGDSIGGYTFQDVMFIWAATSAAFGFSHVLFANVNSLSRLIITGELDIFILQPCNLLVNVLCAKTSLGAYGDLLYGFVLMAFSQGADLAAWGWFLVAMVIGGCLMCAVTLCANVLTFYLGDASLIGSMVSEFMVNFSIYPETIYGPAMRAVMYTVIPAGFIVHVPLRLARHFDPWLACGLLAAACAYFAFAAWFFYRGIRRYESGNVIVTRQ